MANPPPSPGASPLFLREEEIRRGIELLQFGHAALARVMDPILETHRLGRAHQRALYFIGRQPGLSVSALLELLGVTKQSLGRVLDELAERDLVETRRSERDRRQRLLHLTAAGEVIENALFDAARERVAAAYSAAGQSSVTGFWRVLENLLDNAVSFSPDGGLVQIVATVADNQVLVSVEDEGPGVPPEERETVFRRFHSVRPEHEQFGKHSGLGLAIARSIVEGHQGRVSVGDRDDTHSGACFIVRLPMAQSGDPGMASE